MPKVHIRKKPLTKGRHSVYLDFSPPLRNPKTGKPQRFEFLDIFFHEIFDLKYMPNLCKRRLLTKSLCIGLLYC